MQTVVVCLNYLKSSHYGIKHVPFGFEKSECFSVGVTGLGGKTGLTCKETGFACFFKKSGLRAMSGLDASGFFFRSLVLVIEFTDPCPVEVETLLPNKAIFLSDGFREFSSRWLS